MKSPRNRVGVGLFGGLLQLTWSPNARPATRPHQRNQRRNTSHALRVGDGWEGSTPPAAQSRRVQGMCGFAVLGDYKTPKHLLFVHILLPISSALCSDLDDPLCAYVHLA